MYYDDYYDEPSEFEQQIDEFKDSLVAVVKEEHKAEIQRLREENARLSAIENEMKEAIKQNESGLADIERRKNNLKSEVEDEFYKTNLDDVVNRILSKWDVWYAESIGYEQPKCDLCNDERKQVAIFPNGKESVQACECSGMINTYEPRLSEISYLKIAKRDSRYRSDRAFHITRSYEPNKESRNFYSDYSYREWQIEHIVSEFCDETKQLHEDKNYGVKIAFISQEECQKYCDWLNLNEQYDLY